MVARIVFLDRSTLPERVQLKCPTLPHQWQNFDLTAAEQVVARLQGAQVVVVNKVPLNGEQLRQLPDLKLVAVAATGVDRVDLAACRALGIGVCNIQGYANHAVAEHTLALMLALSRRLLPYQQALQAGAWQQSPHFCLFGPPLHDLAGKQLGLIGSGALGQAVARLGDALGMRVVFAARHAAAADAALAPVDGRWPRQPLAGLLASSDVVSLHCPLTPDTAGLIGAAELALMKPEALLINTARGGLVDEEALLQALLDQRLGGAACDVARREPPLADDPLLRALASDRFLLTPHIAWASDEAMQGLADQLIDNVDAFLRGERLRRVD